MSFFRDLRWRDTVTIFHRETGKDEHGKTNTQWMRSTASGCFYGLSRRQSVEGTVLSEHDRHVVRIPGSEISALERGDVICRGIVETTIPQNSSPEKLLSGIDHFTAETVADNRQLPRTSHWYAAEG